MTIRLAVTVFLFSVLSPCIVFAQNTSLFDVIVPSEIELRTSNNSIGQVSGGYGWLIAVGDTLTSEDLQGATFNGTVSESAITSVDPQFLNAGNAAPIAPGEAVGSTFQDSLYSPLLLAGEDFVGSQGGLLLGLGLRFPTSPTYTGSSFDFDGSLTIRGETVNFSTAVTVSRADASSSSLTFNPQRVSSAVPEPSSATVLIGIFGLGLTRRYRS